MVQLGPLWQQPRTKFKLIPMETQHGNVAQHKASSMPKNIGNTSENARFKDCGWGPVPPILKPCGLQLGAELRPHGSNLWPSCAILGAKSGRSWSQVGPSWAEVGVFLAEDWNGAFGRFCTDMHNGLFGGYTYGILLLLPSKSGQYTSPTWDSKNLASKSTKQAIPYINGWFPAVILLCFAFWGREGAIKMHAPENRNTAGTLLDLCWNFVGRLPDPCSTLPWTSWKWNAAGTWWNLAGTSPEPSCWNPWLEHLAGKLIAGVDFVFLFIVLLALLNVLGCESWSWKSGLNFAGTVLQPCWNLCEDNFWIVFGFHFVLVFLEKVAGNERPRSGIFAGTFSLEPAWTLQKTLCWSPCRNTLGECLAGCLAGTCGCSLSFVLLLWLFLRLKCRAVSCVMKSWNHGTLKNISPTCHHIDCPTLYPARNQALGGLVAAALATQVHRAGYFSQQQMDDFTSDTVFHALTIGTMGI